MNRIQGWSALCGAALLLAACGGGGSNNFAFPPAATSPSTGAGNATPQPTINVDDLSAGAYVVSLGDANAPTVGKYYAGADGSRLLVVSNDTDLATQIYRRDTKGGWVAVPAVAQSVSVNLLQSHALPDTGAALSKVAGHYRAQVTTGVDADFTVAADGSITPGNSACKLSGQLTAGTLPNTLKLTLATSGCDPLPASATGVAALDSDYAPAGFRLIADNGSKLAELWAYAD